MTTGGLYPIENLFANGMSQAFGDPIYSGLIILLFFGGFVFLQNTRLDTKIAIMTPVAILTIIFLGPIIGFLIMVVGGLLIYFALMRVINK